MIVADPPLTVKHASAIATILARRLDVDYFDMLTRLRKPDTQFQYVARRVPSTLAKSSSARSTRRGYKGIDTRRDPVRTYPADDVAANLVGFMNDQGDAGEGAELMFDTMLSGKDGSATYETGGGNRIPLGDNSTVPPKSGHDLELTIDRDVQWYTQRVVRSAVQGSGGSSGSAVVMDTHTGQLLALADYPTFDANQPSLSLQGQPRLPRAARRLRAGLGREGADRLVADRRRQGHPEHQDHRARRACRAATGSSTTTSPHAKLHLTLTGVIAKSSNIGTVLAASQFKHQELYDYLRKFGLGARTGIGVRGETPGVLNTGRTGRRSTRTPSPSGRAWPSTPSRWPPRSTPWPTAASTSSRAWSRARRPPPAATSSGRPPPRRTG